LHGSFGNMDNTVGKLGKERGQATNEWICEIALSEVGCAFLCPWLIDDLDKLTALVESSSSSLARNKRGKGR
jgi:hypothetical protein